MKKTTFRLLGLFLAMFAMSQPSQAGDLIDAIRDAINESHYYSRVTAHAVGEGKVYVSFNTPSSDPAYTTPKFSANSGTTGVENSGDHTYYLYAQANEGYEFVGWYEDANCTKLASENNPYQASVSSHQGSDIPDDGTGADHYFYAKFVPITVKLNGSGYATFASKSAIDFSNASGYTAWAITSITGTTIKYQQITGAVAAGTGVFLMGTAGEVITPEYVASGEELEENLLVGITEPITVAANEYYGLSGDNFKKVSAGANIPAGKALLNASDVAATGAKALTFSFEEDATGIETIENAVEDGAIYNMAGQRLNKMQKGINIVNGKKILKK